MSGLVGESGGKTSLHFKEIARVAFVVQHFQSTSSHRIGKRLTISPTSWQLESCRLTGVPFLLFFFLFPLRALRRVLLCAYEPYREPSTERQPLLVCEPI